MSTVALRKKGSTSELIRFQKIAKQAVHAVVDCGAQYRQDMHMCIGASEPVIVAPTEHAPDVVFVARGNRHRGKELITSPHSRCDLLFYIAE